jgi:hypothetical protein
MLVLVLQIQEVVAVLGMQAIIQVVHLVAAV